MSNRLEMIKDLIVEFDEMGYEPSLTLCPDRVEEINNFRRRLKNILHISQEQEKVLSIIFEKNVDILELRILIEHHNDRMVLKLYNRQYKKEWQLTQDEFNTLKEHFKYE